MKKLQAFSLLEIILTFIVFGIIVSVVLINAKPVVKRNSNAMMTYSAYMTLKKGVGDYIAHHGMITSAKDLCTSIATTANLIDTINCSAVWSDIADTPNLTFANGIKIYNLGAPYTDDNEHTAENLIAQIKSAEEELTALAETDPYNLEAYNEKLEEIRTKKNTLADVGAYYTIYVDIDGPHGKRQKENDVITFLVSLYGEVLPYGVASDTKNYLVAEYRYFENNKWNWGIEDSSKKYFRYAICKSGTNLHVKNYCAGISPDEKCSKAPCDVIIRH